MPKATPIKKLDQAPHLEYLHEVDGVVRVKVTPGLGKPYVIEKPITDQSYQEFLAQKKLVTQQALELNGKVLPLNLTQHLKTDAEIQETMHPKRRRLGYRPNGQ